MEKKREREKREFLMDTNSTFLLFISKQVECIDFQSKLLDYIFIF